MISDIERRGLKSVVTLAVREAGGQVNCAGFSQRIKRPAAFSDYGNHEIDDRHIPLDVAVEIDRFNKNGRILRAASQLSGFLLLPTPRVLAANSTVEALSHVAKEGGEATAALAGLLDGGGKPSHTQVNYAIKQIDEAIEALLEARSRLAPPPELGE